MTKSELIDRVAERADITRHDATAAVRAVLEEIADELGRGGEVALPGFGKFHVADRPGRRGRNPATGEQIKIKPSRAPRLSAGSTLKRAANGRG